jgi:hypothetical protein
MVTDRRNGPGRRPVADDGKRTELICFKVTERMALDLLRLSTSQDRTTSDFMYMTTRQKLYGDMVRLDIIGAQFTTSDKVDQ